MNRLVRVWNRFEEGAIAFLLAAMERRRAPDLRAATLAGTRFLVLDPYASDVREAPGAAFTLASQTDSRTGLDTGGDDEHHWPEPGILMQ